jgi:hypothetical protein
MWICTKNNQLINTDKVQCFSILKGKSYYDDDAVLTAYCYVCADGNRVIKTANQDDALTEFANIQSALKNGETVYTANGIAMAEDEHANAID